MVQGMNPDNALRGTRKRHIMSAEFSGKFDCKQDFVKYFRDQRKSQLQWFLTSL